MYEVVLTKKIEKSLEKEGINKEALIDDIRRELIEYELDVKQDILLFLESNNISISVFGKKNGGLIIVENLGTTTIQVRQ